MKDALLLREDCNVIVVDWSIGAKEDYPKSAGNTRLVGAMVGELIRFLISSVGGSTDLGGRFYVVGASLGAQATRSDAGFLQGYAAGYAAGSEKGCARGYLKHNANITLGRITGISDERKLITVFDCG